MKLSVIAVALLGAAVASSAAFAADLPSRREAPVFVPPPALPVFTWSGFYAGINAGYAFDNDTRYSLSGNDPLTAAAIGSGARPAFFRTRSDGFTGGAQIGYNFEIPFGSFGGAGNGVVAGVEADAAYTDLRRSGDYIGTDGSDANFRSRTDYVGTVRGRLGYAFGNLLLYGTGGFAYGGVRNNVNYFTAVGGVNNFSGATDTIRTGYAYGGGIEYALPTTSFLNFFHSSAVTLKVEYIHYNLGTQTLAVNNTLGFGTSYTARIRNDGNLVRAGINYKFDLFGGAGPAFASR